MRARRPGGRRRTLAGTAVAIVLAVATVAVIGPARVADLMAGVRPAPLAVAFAHALVAVWLRGLRLQLVLPAGAVGPVRAALIAAAAQAATGLVPARLGELALPWLVHRHAGRDAAGALAALLAVRVLDLAGLAVWAALAVAMTGRALGWPVLVVAALLALPALALPVTVRWADRLVLRWVAVRGRRGRRWARRVRRVRHELERLAARPWRLVAAFAAASALWGILWSLTRWLLLAMGLDWPWWTVVAGSAAASAASAVPITSLAGVGPLEAGWTAGFVALGIDLEVAAASGLACHVWSLLFVAVLGAMAWGVLAAAGGSAAEPRQVP